MTPDQLRAAYLDFFASKQHRVVASSPVVPEGDPTLLFTNAGMNQFKDVLLGLEKRDYVRAASVQKCIRAGGKHNDLDEVGKDGRHLTFFEMLGNWSFGEYYKREAILWAWEFVLDRLKLDRDRLYVSVHVDDADSYRIWNEVVGLAPTRIVKLTSDNFWAMGPTGPCGPCTEIYYDHHPERGPEPWEPGFDDERFMEIWNLVFMESNAEETGDLTPLPMQSVDTGMGLDRVAAILAGVDNVFQTGLFGPILERTHALLTGEHVAAADLHGRPDFTAYCVIADHVRTVTFSVCDGATFSNEGRGYVLRRILRRAVRHGRELGFGAPFLCDVADAVIETFQHVYPELRLKGSEAKTIIRTEEARFFRTIDRGIELFESVAADTTAAGRKVIDGDSVFKLYDTFGFPPDLTEIMAEERGLSIDKNGYQAAMQAQRERSRAADDRYAGAGEWVILMDGAADTFVGYEHLTAVSDVLRYRTDESGRVEVCLRETPFYAESGGQVGDRGTLLSEDGTLELRVVDTRKTTAGITHVCEVINGHLAAEKLRKPVAATVDAELRHLTACNHTATHLLHAALHKFVSETAFQAGSHVSAERLRFDFSHDQPVATDKLRAIEAWVNSRIRENAPIKTHLNVRLEDAERMGAMMIFGEKYGAEVRVIEVPGTSTELCGGTHVRETNDIAYLRIVSESGVAAGVRRIEAVTNERAFEHAEAERARIAEIADLLRAPVGAIEEKIQRLLTENRELERRVEALTVAQAGGVAAELVAAARSVGGFALVAARSSASTRSELLAIADALRDRLTGPAVALLVGAIDDKPALIAIATDAAVAKGANAGRLVAVAAAEVGGKGGGKPTLAQAGGQDVGGIERALGAFTAAVAQLGG
ncbi:MAG: alanine--tRNA ligase [Myxococcales bacterium]|nr:alanine--tRNA ligase [Myxococcales bacterium]MCB9532998.1 alanine--tRNA ligase [Myxococcales bacterium]